MSAPHPSPPPDETGRLAFRRLSWVQLILAMAVEVKMAVGYAVSGSLVYVAMAFMTMLFIGAQTWALRTTARSTDIKRPTSVVVGTLIIVLLSATLVLAYAPIVTAFFLATIPVMMATTRQLNRLPATMVVAFASAALILLLDLTLPWRHLRRAVDITPIVIFYGAGLCVYLACAAWIARGDKRPGHPTGFQINVATQYTLVISVISAVAIVLVTGVLTSQIRRAQITQVGKNFQTIAENIAKQTGAHLEQQTQKLQLLTQQVSLFKSSLIQSNRQHQTDRRIAEAALMAKNRHWQGPARDERFVMSRLNNPIIQELSQFRGHNSFHKNIMLVDAYGGLIASLGKRPATSYFFDQSWWQLSWNKGLGNTFIGDLDLEDATKVPTVRIVVDIIDHTSNKLIGVLSSTYLLRTLVEDLGRFKPDSVDQISLIDADGRVVASSQTQLAGHLIWPLLKEQVAPKDPSEACWVLGRDHRDRDALIGYASTSTVYSVISDPLRRLGWSVVVSGTRSNALFEVNRSTKIALLAGLVAMTLGVLGAIAAARVITRPIENLTETASAMSSGDLTNRAQLAGPEELIRLSEAFNQLTERLGDVIHNLQNQTSELIYAKQEAETATQLKGQFLANMSHEIRTPLNAILGFADILAAEMNDPRHQRHAKTIKSSGTDLLLLINDILDLSKIEAGRMEIQPAAVDLRELFQEMHSLFSINAGEKQIDLNSHIAEALPASLMLDRMRLRQVLFNLIGNAVKFTDRGEVAFHATAVKTNTNGHWDLRIDVRDTGIGIDPDKYTDIFESFSQTHVDTLGHQEGTGLGLAISKSLVELMGGRIDVGAQPDGGTLFSVHLPRVLEWNESTAASGRPSVGPAKPPAAAPFGPCRILIADDLETNRNLITEALRPTSAIVQSTDNGRTAVTMAQNGAYDAILLDIRMPDMDGHATIEAIRRHRHLQSTPIIALTASGMAEDIHRIQHSGFSDYLIRPFDRTELLGLLSRHLPHAFPEHVVPETTVAPSHFSHSETWACTPEADREIEIELKHHWQQAIEKQSIPDIRAFARRVQEFGDRFEIAALSRYGEELGAATEAFDIEQVESLLEHYPELVDRRTVAPRGKQP